MPRFRIPNIQGMATFFIKSLDVGYQSINQSIHPSIHQSIIFSFQGLSGSHLLPVLIKIQIQITMVGMVSGLKGRNYQEKLKELGLQTLQTRRRRFDMIQTFKILKGFDRVDSSIWFETVGNLSLIHI